MHQCCSLWICYIVESVHIKTFHAVILALGNYIKWSGAHSVWSPVLDKEMMRQDIDYGQCYCCYHHRTNTSTMVVSYHRTNTAMAVFYSVLCGLSGRCFLTSAAQSNDSLVI